MAIAIVLGVWQPVSIDTIMGWGHRFASEPMALAAVIIVQGLMFAFALPGSLLIWFVAPFLAPLVAVPVLLAGSLVGVAGGYVVSSRLGGDWRPRHGAWLIDIVERRSDFFTQCALRVLPGCPHWVVNYSAGVLRLPLMTVLLAAAVGLSMKWTVYASAIHGIGSAAEARGEIGMTLVLPLVVLTAFLFVGSVLRRRLIARASDNTATAQNRD